MGLRLGHGGRHRIAVTRSAAVPADFLQGETPEVWVSDRYGAQAGHGQAHQLCLAHLLRDAQYAIDAGDTVFAPGFKRLLKRALAIGGRREALADSTLVQYRRDLDRRLDALLATAPTTRAGRKLRDGMAKCRDKLFVFVTRRDVPPTNNVSERRLRPSVIFRKVTASARCGAPRSMRRSARSSPPPRCAASTLSRPSTPASPDNPSSSLPDQASTMGMSNYHSSV